MSTEQSNVSLAKPTKPIRILVEGEIKPTPKGDEASGELWLNGHFIKYLSLSDIKSLKDATAALEPRPDVRNATDIIRMVLRERENGTRNIGGDTVDRLGEVLKLLNVEGAKSGKVAKFYSLTPDAKKIFTLMQTGKTVEEAIAIVNVEREA